MLTRLRVRNFKTLENADIPLGQSSVLIGPNNSGKTSGGMTEWGRVNAQGDLFPPFLGVTLK